MSRSRVYQWCTWFGEGRTSLGDEPKSGRPKTSTNEENTTRVDELIRCDRRMKLREIALKLEIPKSTIHEIVHDTLGYRKVSARWIPKMLTEDHKLERVEISQRLLQRCQQDNGDEDTTHIGVILLDILPQGQCINAARYCSTLDQHDNATPHSANLTQQWLQRYGWEILPHPPLKRHLGGMAFETEDDLISELRNWFVNLDVDFFRGAVGVFGDVDDDDEDGDDDNSDYNDDKDNDTDDDDDFHDDDHDDNSTVAAAADNYDDDGSSSGGDDDDDDDKDEDSDHDDDDTTATTMMMMTKMRIEITVMMMRTGR
ncbi:LOW QUALITY PROTEIN: histone-lysine N-methyltransferase SETMAR [Plakobranchus ocellatus]|uniref:Histone-lysine N-methyltransferase SETMAR n=1 Tax=Plakobranchus ocellatus TaxID=259542 RepID=A0AAV4BJ24_9GAST|nr:LOW QUALITY PROTEIN: histone-lysine N-methyltransferase SETMAR [Plakobranchus ocellatus]